MIYIKIKKKVEFKTANGSYTKKNQTETETQSQTEEQTTTQQETTTVTPTTKAATTTQQLQLKHRRQRHSRPLLRPSRQRNKRLESGKHLLRKMHPHRI